MIACSRCKEVLDESKFTVDLYSRRGFSSACKSCRSSGDRAKRASNSKLKLEHKLTRTEKPCTKCKEIKHVNMFDVSRDAIDGRDSNCKECRKTYRRNVHSPMKRNRISDLKLKCIDMLGGKCSMCGIKPSSEWPIACFDFHHKYDKSFHIATKIQVMLNESAVLEEIKKCVVLCANCHRKHHYLNLSCSPS